MPGAILAAAAVVASLVSTVPIHPDRQPVDIGPPSTDAAESRSEEFGEIGSPGDALGLSPGELDKPKPGPIRVPLAPAGGAGLGGAVIASAVLVRRNRARSASGSEDPLFVYVPGHGGGLLGFADLADRMGVEAKDVRFFDYRWAWPTSDRIEASQRATADDAADALGAYLAALGGNGRPIYVIGHSKGGAVITEVVSRWDEHPAIGVDAVVGAAILDPPISSGPLGLLQSLGWLHGGTADDGLFDPIRCGWTGCRDVRDGLGQRAGVEVVIIRNPDAEVTNFRDRPEGVRVYDLDDGRGSVFERFPNVFGMWSRIGEAHSSVLHSDTVAACITAEAHRVGSCTWPTPDAPETAPSSRIDVDSQRRQQLERDAGRHGRMGRR